MEPTKLTLSDKLAIARTALANERTFMAYSRTALAFLISGVSLIRFFNYLATTIIGWTLLPIGAAVVIFGFKRFKMRQREIKEAMTVDAAS